VVPLEQDTELGNIAVTHGLHERFVGHGPACQR
jgi:hypothetical protein